MAAAITINPNPLVQPAADYSVTATGLRPRIRVYMTVDGAGSTLNRQRVGRDGSVTFSEVMLVLGNHRIEIHNYNGGALLVFGTLGVQKASGPVISGVTISGITQSAATVSWHVSVLSSGTLETRVKGTTAWVIRQPQQIDPTYQDHVQTVGGLLADTAYETRVTSADAAGVATTSSTYEFRTLPVIINPPPIDPGAREVAPTTVRTASDIRAWLIDRGPTARTALVANAIYPGTLNLNGLSFDLDGQFALIDASGYVAQGITLEQTHDFALRRLRAKGKTVVTPGNWDYPSEQNHALYFGGAVRGIVEDIDVDTFAGDGAYIAHWGMQPTQGVTFRRIGMHRIGRMGWGVVAGKDLLVDGHTYENMGYSLVDIEPEYNSATNGTIQGAWNCTWLNGTSRGWVGGSVGDHVTNNMGTPSQVGPIAPVVDGITIRGLVIWDAKHGAWTTVGQGAYRMTNITLENIEGKHDFGWPTDPVFRLEGVDGLVARNLVNPNGGGKVVGISDCTNVTTT